MNNHIKNFRCSIACVTAFLTTMTATISAAQLHYHCLSDNNHSKNFSCSNALLSPFWQQISQQEFQMLNCIIVAKVLTAITASLISAAQLCCHHLSFWQQSQQEFRRLVTESKRRIWVQQHTSSSSIIRVVVFLVLFLISSTCSRSCFLALTHSSSRLSLSSLIFLRRCRKEA